MIRLLLVLFTLVGFLIFSYPFLVAQVSLGKRDPHARDLETIKVVRSVFKVLLKLAGVTVTVTLACFPFFISVLSTDTPIPLSAV